MSNAEFISAALGVGFVLPALVILSRRAHGGVRRSIPWRIGIALAAVPWLAAIYMVGFGSARDVSAAPDSAPTESANYQVEDLPNGMRLEGRWRQAGEGHGFRFELVGDGRYLVRETSSSGQLLARGKALLDGRTVGIEMDALPRHWDGATLHAERPSWRARLYLDRESITGEALVPGEGEGWEVELGRVD